MANLFQIPNLSHNPDIDHVMIFAEGPLCMRHHDTTEQLLIDLLIYLDGYIERLNDGDYAPIYNNFTWIHSRGQLETIIRNTRYYIFEYLKLILHRNHDTLDPLSVFRESTTIGVQTTPLQSQPTPEQPKHTSMDEQILPTICNSDQPYHRRVSLILNTLDGVHFPNNDSQDQPTGLQGTKLENLPVRRNSKEFFLRTMHLMNPIRFVKKRSLPTLIIETPTITSTTTSKRTDTEILSDIQRRKSCTDIKRYNCDYLMMLPPTTVNSINRPYQTEVQIPKKNKTTKSKITKFTDSCLSLLHSNPSATISSSNSSSSSSSTTRSSTSSSTAPKPVMVSLNDADAYVNKLLGLTYTDNVTADIHSEYHCSTLTLAMGLDLTPLQEYERVLLNIDESIRNTLSDINRDLVYEQQKATFTTQLIPSLYAPLSTAAVEARTIKFPITPSPPSSSSSSASPSAATGTSQRQAFVWPKPPSCPHSEINTRNCSWQSGYCDVANCTPVANDDYANSIGDDDVGHIDSCKKSAPFIKKMKHLTNRIFHFGSAAAIEAHASTSVKNSSNVEETETQSPPLLPLSSLGPHKRKSRLTHHNIKKCRMAASSIIYGECNNGFRHTYTNITNRRCNILHIRNTVDGLILPRAIHTATRSKFYTVEQKILFNIANDILWALNGYIINPLAYVFRFERHILKNRNIIDYIIHIWRNAKSACKVLGYKSLFVWVMPSNNVVIENDHKHHFEFAYFKPLHYIKNQLYTYQTLYSFCNMGYMMRCDNTNISSDDIIACIQQTMINELNW